MVTLYVDKESYLFHSDLYFYVFDVFFYDCVQNSHFLLIFDVLAKTVKSLYPSKGSLVEDQRRNCPKSLLGILPQKVGHLQAKNRLDDFDVCFGEGFFGKINQGYKIKGTGW